MKLQNWLKMYTKRNILKNNWRSWKKKSFYIYKSKWFSFSLQNNPDYERKWKTRLTWRRLQIQTFRTTRGRKTVVWWPLRNVEERTLPLWKSDSSFQREFGRWFCIRPTNKGIGQIFRLLVCLRRTLENLDLVFIKKIIINNNHSFQVFNCLKFTFLRWENRSGELSNKIRKIYYIFGRKH